MLLDILHITECLRLSYQQRFPLLCQGEENHGNESASPCFYCQRKCSQRPFEVFPKANNNSSASHQIGSRQQSMDGFWALRNDSTFSWYFHRWRMHEGKCTWNKTPPTTYFMVRSDPLSMFQALLEALKKAFDLHESEPYDHFLKWATSHATVRSIYIMSN